jgi:hypothetical protein
MEILENSNRRQCVVAGTYYAGCQAQGKSVRASLETDDVLTTAKAPPAGQTQRAAKTRNANRHVCGRTDLIRNRNAQRLHVTQKQIGKTRALEHRVSAAMPRMFEPFVG